MRRELVLPGFALNWLTNTKTSQRCNRPFGFLYSQEVQINASFLRTLHPPPPALPKATSCYKERAAGKKTPNEDQEEGPMTENSEHSFLVKDVRGL